jgi:hypothetical protein
MAALLTDVLLPAFEDAAMEQALDRCAGT